MKILEVNNFLVETFQENEYNGFTIRYDDQMRADKEFKSIAFISTRQGKVIYQFKSSGPSIDELLNIVYQQIDNWEPPKELIKYLPLSQDISNIKTVRMDVNLAGTQYITDKTPIRFQLLDGNIYIDVMNYKTYEDFEFDVISMDFVKITQSVSHGGTHYGTSFPIGLINNLSLKFPARYTISEVQSDSPEFYDRYLLKFHSKLRWLYDRLNLSVPTITFSKGTR